MIGHSSDMDDEDDIDLEPQIAAYRSVPNAFEELSQVLDALDQDGLSDAELDWLFARKRVLERHLEEQGAPHPRGRSR